MMFITHYYIPNPNGVRDPQPTPTPPDGTPPGPGELSPERQAAANKAFVGLGILAMFMLGAYVLAK